MLSRSRAPLLLLAASIASLVRCAPSGPTPSDVPGIDAVLDAADTAPAIDTTDAPALPPPEVTLPEGALRGLRGNGYRAFLGIPYAAPPVGPLRWRAPQPPAPWTAVRDATATPSKCPQSLLGTVSGSEDCLYLNVHTPDPAPQGAPVIVWLHGGAFVFGEGLQVDGGTRGDILASRRGVVVVSINYRLGALGFMAHPALTSEGNGHSGNYGLLDQRAAMQWVRDHIAAFGGDPHNVTLAGESAGGMSVCAHLVSPLSTGLFQRAIVESGPCGLPVPTLATSEAQGTRLATVLGCTSATDASCLRAATADQVLSALPPPPGFVSSDPMYAQWSPIVDGAFYPDDPIVRTRAGNFQHVPVLFGWNHDEGTLFVMLASQTGITAAQYPDAVRAVLRTDATRSDRVLTRYPLSAYPSPWQALSAVVGDYFLICPARRTLRAMMPFLPAAYAYYFTYPMAGFQLGSDVPLGAFHSAEIQFVFGHPARIGRSQFYGDELTLHHAMMGYWTRFATTGDPNGEGAVPWPAYSLAGDAQLVIDVTQTAGTGASADACAFWESLGLYP